MSNRSIFFTIIIAIALLVLYSSFFVVSEGEAALTLRLGELTKTASGQPKVYGPGIHFKWPFIVAVRHFNVRLRSLNVDASRILTEEQKYVLINYYAKWRISNLAMYYTRTGGYDQRAQQLLQQKINDALRAQIGIHTIKEVISGERTTIMQNLLAKANESARDLGIDVTDVRIVAIDLPKEVRQSVFERMSSQREQVATKHRAQGQAKAEAIRANADATVAVTLAEARTVAQKIRASGDAEAAKIYSEAYDQDPTFYALYRSLQAYRQVFDNKKTVMVLTPKTTFLRYFNENPSVTNPSGGSVTTSKQQSKKQSKQ